MGIKFTLTTILIFCHHLSTGCLRKGDLQGVIWEGIEDLRIFYWCWELVRIYLTLSRLSKLERQAVRLTRDDCILIFIALRLGISVNTQKKLRKRYKKPTKTTEASPLLQKIILPVETNIILTAPTIVISEYAYRNIMIKKMKQLKRKRW